MDESTLDQIVADFYQAAAGEKPWGIGMERLRLAMSAQLVNLYGLTKATQSVALSYEVGIVPPQAALEFIRHYHQLEPRAMLLMNKPVGQALSCHQHLDEAFVQNDPFYQEFLIPQGIRYTTGVKIFEDEHHIVFCGIHRGVGMSPLNQLEEACISRLSKHLQQAMSVHLSRQSPPQQIGAEILNTLPHPILLMDDVRRVVFQNDSAIRFIETHTALQVRQGFLCGPSSDDDARLLIALRSLALSGNSYLSPAHLALEKAFCLLEATGHGRVGMCLHALRPDKTMGAFGTQPLAMALLYDPDAKTRLDELIVTAMWDLTPAEAQAVVALSEGMSTRDIAKKRGVSYNTVRSQIQSAMSKTGAIRQAELVSRAASAPPIQAAQ